MKIFLAAIIFSFFAVFAPNSHGDRPLLLAEPKIGQIQYSDFKLPIARLQTASVIKEPISFLFLSPYFVSTEPFLNLNVVLFLNQNFALRNNLAVYHTSPLVFCEILQI